MPNSLTLSSLGHTWLIDLDGTLLKHNGYKLDGFDTLLSGTKEFLNAIPEEDTVIFLTSRTEDMKEQTEAFLAANGLRANHIIYNLPMGERILLNDAKPSGLTMAYAINLERDSGSLPKPEIDFNL